MGWCLFASANAAHPALSNGDGTVSNPYQISKAQDLVDLSTYVNQQIESANTLTYYTITADIDMSGINFYTNRRPQYPHDLLLYQRQS